MKPLTYSPPLATALMASALTVATALPALAADKPTLTVYTYDSFITEWGPGPEIKSGFEATCACTVEFIAPGDATETFNRLRLEGKNSEADVLVGLDSNLVAAADKSGLFEPTSIDTSAISLPIDWDASTYVPFDWGYFAFVYDADKLTEVPTSLEALADAPVSILIEDPRSSTPGLGLLLWVKQAYGDRAPEIWQKLQPHIVTVTKGWSEAYGMFLEDQADMVLSYTTSPAYHVIAEEKTNFKAARFDEGHYMQVELAAITANSDNKELANDFLAYLISPEVQKIIPTTNWMYPAALPDEQLPDAFKALEKPDKALLMDPKDVPDVRKQALDEWLAALSQ